MISNEQDDYVKKKFEEFIKQQGKDYLSQNEKEFRLNIFRQNFKIISGTSKIKGFNGYILLGDDNTKSYTKKINKFADMSQEEFTNFYLLSEDVLYFKIPQKNDKPIYKVFQSQHDINEGRRLFETRDLPQKLDWNERGYVTSVKDQQQCQSCYIFSALGAVESLFYIKSNQNIELSAQESIDCNSYSQGCKGGQPSQVLQYIKENGIYSETQYPYKAKKGVCEKEQGRRLKEDPYNNLEGFFEIVRKNKGHEDSFTDKYSTYKYGKIKEEEEKNLGQNLDPDLQKNSIFSLNQQTQNPFYNNSEKKDYDYINRLSQFDIDQIIDKINYENQKRIEQLYSRPVNSINYDNHIDYQKQTQYNLPQLLTNQNNQYQVQKQKHDFSLDDTIEQQNYKNTYSQLEAIPLRTKLYPQESEKQKIFQEEMVSPLFTQQQPQEYQQDIIRKKKEDIYQIPEHIPQKKEQNQQYISQGEQDYIPLQSKPIKQKQKSKKILNEEISLKKFIQKPLQKYDQRFNNLSNFQQISQNIVSLLQALQTGPVIVAHQVTSEFKFYSQGIYDGADCDDNSPVNHSALLVGYDLSGQIPYFILRNSWGKNWGDGGYYKMKIGNIDYDSTGLCQIAGTPFNIQPIIKQQRY